MHRPDQSRARAACANHNGRDRTRPALASILLILCFAAASSATAAHTADAALADHAEVQCGQCLVGQGLDAGAPAGAVLAASVPIRTHLQVGTRPTRVCTTIFPHWISRAPPITS